MVTNKKKTKKKPLDKMTAKELRDLAMELPEVTGVHGMNKTELIGAIKKARGIEETPGKLTDSSIREIKQKIRGLKSKREAVIKDNDPKMAAIYRHRITRLKKKTRRAA